MKGLAIGEYGDTRDLQDGGAASDSDSSSSLEMHDLPCYNDIVPSIASDEDEHAYIPNSILAHIAVDVHTESARNHDGELPRQPQATSLEEQV